MYDHNNVVFRGKNGRRSSFVAEMPLLSQNESRVVECVAHLLLVQQHFLHSTNDFIEDKLYGQCLLGPTLRFDEYFY